jgi:uncharacterized cofD-like protein
MENIVTIGGGTGSYTVLSGLKNIPNVSLSALVSMADDGGSTGMLMDELGVLPPGDVRQCLVALSEHSDIVRKLMGYRFSQGSLKGHSFGNILLAALEKVTGDFTKGVEIASEILKVKGRVIPITKDKAKLIIQLSNGSIIMGENNIYQTGFKNLTVKKIFFKNKVKLNIHAREAILQADYIILGPGNYYCSLTPNLIVNGFKKTIMTSKAKIVLPVNLTNKSGQTTYWQASDYVKNTEKYLGRKIDFIILNNQSPSEQQIKKYKTKEGEQVLVKDDLRNEKRVIRVPLLSDLTFTENDGDTLAQHRAFIRHDSNKLADCIEKIIVDSALGAV